MGGRPWASRSAEGEEGKALCIEGPCVVKDPECPTRARLPNRNLSLPPVALEPRILGRPLRACCAASPLPRGVACHTSLEFEDLALSALSAGLLKSSCPGSLPWGSTEGERSPTLGRQRTSPTGACFPGACIPGAVGMSEGRGSGAGRGPPTPPAGPSHADRGPWCDRCRGGVALRTCPLA